MFIYEYGVIINDSESWTGLISRIYIACASVELASIQVHCNDAILLWTVVFGLVNAFLNPPVRDLDIFFSHWNECILLQQECNEEPRGRKTYVPKFLVFIPELLVNQLSQIPD